MLADIRRPFMSKESFFSPDFLHRTRVTGLQFNRYRESRSNFPVLLPPTDIVSLYFYPIRGMDCRPLFSRFAGVTNLGLSWGCENICTREII